MVGSSKQSLQDALQTIRTMLLEPVWSSPEDEPTGLLQKLQAKKKHFSNVTACWLKCCWTTSRISLYGINARRAMQLIQCERNQVAKQPHAKITQQQKEHAGQSSEQPVPAGPSQCRKKKQPSSRNGASRQEAPSLATNIQSNDVAPHAQWVDPATFSQQDGLLSVPSQSSWSSRSSSPQSSVGPSPGSPVDTFGMCMPVKVAADDTLLDFANEIFSQTNDVTWMLDYMKRVANSGVNMLEFAELLQAMQMCVGSNSAPL